MARLRLGRGTHGRSDEPHTRAYCRLVACLFLATDGQLPDRDWLVRRFSTIEETLSPLAVLAGRPTQPQADGGPQICVCFNVGLNTLVNTIRDQKLGTLDEVGDVRQAGTNCGSCRPQIQGLLRAAAPAPVHA